jgi:autotransporter family porin
VTNKSNSFYKRTTILLPLLLISLGLIFTVSVNNVSAAPGDTIYVNGSSGNDTSNGSSWILAKKTIKNATDNVNINGKVNIANGNYSGVNNTQITITKNMNIIGQSQTGTIINGTGTNWIFYIKSGNVTITNLTLTNATKKDGGAIYNQGTLTIDNCTFTANTANDGNGGAIYNQGDLTITDTTIKDNTANSTGEDVYGGGIYNEGTLTINNSTITNNTATGTNGNAYGGGIYNSGTLIINNSTITNNTATTTDGYADGGGISNEEGTLTITDTTIKDNIAIGTSNAYGGGISHSFLGNLTINNSIITNNTATAIGGDVYGGGISNWGAFLTINNSTITGNTATGTNNVYGGGISNNGDLTITDTTIKDNIAIGTNNVYGGGIYNLGTLTVVNCSIENNNAGDGGGIFNELDTLNVTGSNFISNSATNGGAIYNQGPANVHFNRIVGNTAIQGSAIYNGMGTVNATDNWWGSNNPNFSTIISGVVNYTPWLYLTFAAAPLSIPDGSTSTLTASFNQDTNGTTITQLDPVLGHIPDGTPLTFTTDLGNVGSKSVVKYTLNGIGTAILRADETAGIAHVNGITDSQTLNSQVNINPKSSLYLTITPNKTNPVTGETVIYTLKVGNKGPDMAKDVVMTYIIPQGLEFAGANVDNGTYTYDKATRTITWTIGDVPVGDHNMWLSLHIIKAGNYLINPKLRTSTYDPTLNQNTQSITFNAINPVNPVPVNTVEAANIISMQDTGVPIVPLAIAVLSILGGLAANRRK